MDINKVKKKRRILENTIIYLIGTFEKETGVNVDSITLEHHEVKDKHDIRLKAFVNYVKVNISI